MSCGATTPTPVCSSPLMHRAYVSRAEAPLPPAAISTQLTCRGARRQAAGLVGQPVDVAAAHEVERPDTYARRAGPRPAGRTLLAAAAHQGKARDLEIDRVGNEDVGAT